MTGAAQCANRGCHNLVATSGGRAMGHCRDCLMGQRPAFRRKLVAADGVEAMGAMPQPPGGFAFRVPGSPMSWNEAMTIWRGRITPTARAREWKKAVALYALRARPRNWDQTGRYGLDIHSVFASPLADRDNPVKLIQDALAGVCWTNDRQVVEGRTSKAHDPLAARVEITVRRLPAGGPTG